MSELFANHSEGRVELITLQDNEARGKKFVGARVHFLYLLVQTNIVYDSYSRGNIRYSIMILKCCSKF